MNRLQVIFKKKSPRRKFFCAYVTMGFPRLKFTEQLIVALEKSGVDILELGIPFSDPLADGPVIQSSSFKAIQHGTRFEDAFRLVKKLRAKGVRFPIVFFSYYNPIFNYGLTRFSRRAQSAGFDAVLCPDLPPDEELLLPQRVKQSGMDMIYLVAPTTSTQRARKISRASGSFIYYVSTRGVTGMRKTLDHDLLFNIRRVQKTVKQPVLVGFGVSSPEQVKKITHQADGVIVGSALIRWIDQYRSVKKVAKRVESLVRSLKRAA